MRASPKTCKRLWLLLLQALLTLISATVSFMTCLVRCTSYSSRFRQSSSSSAKSFSSTGSVPEPPRVVAIVLTEAPGTDPKDLHYANQLARLVTWCSLPSISDITVYVESSCTRHLAMVLMQNLPGAVYHVQEGWQSASSCAQAHARLSCQLRLDAPAARTCSCSAPCKGYSAPDKTGGLAAAQVTGALTVRILEGLDSLIPLTMVARAGGRCTGCMATTPGVVKVGHSMHATERLWQEMAAAVGPAVSIRPDVVMVAGPYLTLAGFPPYLVAFSELYHLGCLRTLTEEHVASALARYKRTAQRFGR